MVRTRGHGASGDTDGVLVLLPAHGLTVGARVGHHDQQGLAAELEAPLQDFDRPTIRVFVDFVGQGEVRPRA